MRLSKHLLYNWIDSKINIKKVFEQLTYSGFEVEEVTDFLNIYKNIKIGQIISLKKHPYVKSLLILTINIGQMNHLNIVTDKKYLSKNMKVVVAMHGAILLKNYFVRKKYIHGIISEGIICYFHHLNIFQNKKKIIELPQSARIGLDLNNYYMYQDQLIKVNIPHNRLDTLGILGLAREIAILNHLPIPKILNIRAPSVIKNTSNIIFNLSNIIYSSSYRIIQNINLKKETPIWMQNKLIKCRIDPVNIVIDIINYVFLEFGQSLYVFSHSENIHNIFIEFFQKNKNILINKKKMFYLNDKIIILSNHEKIISFLGNIDFDTFPINLNDNTLFIGSFFLDSVVVYNSIYQLRKNNIDFKNNEYYVNPDNQKNIIEYTTHLFLKICGGTASPIHSVYSENYHDYITRKIKLHHKNIEKIIGCNIDYKIINNILKQLCYCIYSQCDNTWNVIPPRWRIDVLIEEDVISDIMRIYQYNKILPKPLPHSNIIIQNNIMFDALKRSKYLLIDYGYHEVINYSFIDPDIQNLIYPKHKFLSLKNPISKDMSCMRYSLWPGLIKNLCYHQNRQYEEIQLFESGLCFLPNIQEKLGITQALYFSGIISNNNNKYHWDIPAKKIDFYDLKGHIESIFDVLGLLKSITFKKNILSSLHPINSSSIFFKKKLIGHFGELHPKILQLCHLQYSVFLFELFWYKLTFYDTLKIKNISDFPYSRRDISIIIDNDINVNHIISFCKNKFQDVLSDICIFDIYHGSNIDKKKKSISLKFIFQSFVRTLKDSEIDYMMNEYIQCLKNKFNVLLRDK